MKTLFDSADRAGLLQRLENLQPASLRQWGKMSPSQALCHCGRALEMATGDHPVKQKLIGKIIAPFVRSSALGEKPFGKNAPTDPMLVVSDERDLAAERAQLVELIQRFAKGGPESAGKFTHAFFGKLNGDEWGVLMYKHIDHHLRQFGA